MERVRDYEALIRELLAGVAGDWSYGNVIVLLMTKGVDESDLALWLRDFAKGLSLDRDRELIEQLKLLGRMTPGKLASEAFLIANRLDSSYGQGSELLNHEAWLNQGIALGISKSNEEAISYIERAIQIKSEDYESWYNLGIASGNLGRYEESIAHFDRAIKIKPDYEAAWYNRGSSPKQISRFLERGDLVMKESLLCV